MRRPAGSFENVTAAATKQAPHGLADIPVSGVFYGQEFGNAEMDEKRVTVRSAVAGVIGLAVLAYILALVFGALPDKAHIDFAAIVLVIIAAAGVALLFSPKWDATLLQALTRVRAFQFASLKVELEAIRARQDEQTSRLDLLQLLAPLVLAEAEQKHLLNLHCRQTVEYRGNHNVRAELRRLRYLTLITNSKSISTAVDGSTFNLAELVQLTPLGAEWARQLEEMGKPRPDAR
jgi:hypothetical protein